LGSATDEKAGILSMLRQGAGLTTLQHFFDNLDQSQKLLGQIFLEGIQKCWSPGKVQRITGKPPTTQFYSKAFGKYDVNVELGVLTESQRQMQFQQLLYLRETGIPVPPDILLESATLQRKTDLIQALQKQEQQSAEQAQQKMQLEMQLLQAQVRSMQAEADANMGLGIERVSRVRENKEMAVERRAKAIADLDRAAADRAKAVKELESMDMESVHKSLQIMQLMKQQQMESADRLKAQEEQEAARAVPQQAAVPPQAQPPQMP
jgi:hypothetical protein